MKEQKEEIFRFWNSKKITVHRNLYPELSNEIGRQLKHYSVEELMGFIDFYATILEIGVDEHLKKYFWTYKWNLYEFLKRGIKKFEGQDLENYKRKQSVATPEAVILKR